MSKQILFVVFGSLLFCCGKTNAQVRTIDSLVAKNLFKVNVSAVFIQNYQVQYERVLTPGSSITLTIGISSKAPLPFRSTLLKDFGKNEDAKRAIETTIFDKNTITLEYRIYTGHHAPKGFYIAPFARYTNLTISQDYTFTPSDNIKRAGHLNGKMNGYGAGFLLGYQFLIGSRFAIDWWILGPFIGPSTTAHFEGSCNPDFSDMSPQDRADLKSNIEGVKLPLWTTTATIIDPNKINADLKGPFYGIRAMGIAFAIRF